MDLAGAADLAIGQRNVGADHRAVADDHRRPDHAVGLDPAAAADLGAGADHHARADLAALANDREIGRASCRERVCQYVSISVVAVSLKKKNQMNIKTTTSNHTNISI